ncbi:MAG: HypC/HybG/HupF family hydrogenase formation chaperone [Pseudomonadota bacterium]
MCLALPAEIKAINGETATATLNGVEVPISLAFLSGVEVGDFVVVHVGYALSKIEPEIAAAQLSLMKCVSDKEDQNAVR